MSYLFMPKQKTLSRLDRLDELVGLLQTDDFHLTSNLACKLNVTPRTLMRDLDILRNKGYPIETSKGRGGGVRLQQRWGLGRLHLNYQEAIDLLLCLAIMEQIRSPIFLQNLRSIRRKIAASFPDSQKRKIKALRNRIMVADPTCQTAVSPQKTIIPPSATALYEAFFEQKNLTISYMDVEHNKTNRTIEPHFLFLNWPTWYILAWDHLRNDARCFRLDRIKSAKIEKTSFKPRQKAKLLGEIQNFSENL